MRVIPSNGSRKARAFPGTVRTLVRSSPVGWSIAMASSTESSATATVGDGFHLGIEGWSDPESEPPPKRKRLSLKRNQSEPRWDYLTFDEETALSEKCVPKNTATSTKWAISNFESWRNKGLTPSVRNMYRIIFYWVVIVLLCASGCLCMWPRQGNEMGLFFHLRVSTCFSRACCVTYVPRILLALIFLIRLSCSSLGCTMCLPQASCWGCFYRE